jgi:hypothetical protein
MQQYNIQFLQVFALKQTNHRKINKKKISLLDSTVTFTLEASYHTGWASARVTDLMISPALLLM